MLDDIQPPEVSPEFRAYIESITAKRAKTVLTHILEHGYITTDELNQHTTINIHLAQHAMYANMVFN